VIGERSTALLNEAIAAIKAVDDRSTMGMRRLDPYERQRRKAQLIRLAIISLVVAGVTAVVAAIVILNIVGSS
jgi:hypothetical protein